MRSVIHAIAHITSRFDYCSSTFAGVLHNPIYPPQRMENVSVSLNFELTPLDQVAPGLIQLRVVTVAYSVANRLQSRL
jgi:hypothetical protein